MIDPLQALIFSVVIILTVVTTIIGWQIFQILIEIKKILLKINKMMDETMSITGNLGKSIQNINGFSEGLKTVFGIFRIIDKKRVKHE
jgi:hypothetical protein